jgi:hypothetical protein
LPPLGGGGASALPGAGAAALGGADGAPGSAAGVDCSVG